MFMSGVLLTFVIDMFVFIGNSDTSLLLFLKGHFDKPVNSDWLVRHWKGRAHKCCLVWSILTVIGRIAQYI